MHRIAADSASYPLPFDDRALEEVDSKARQAQRLENQHRDLKGHAQQPAVARATSGWVAISTFIIV